ncbi:RNA polymerase sigma factor RpoE [Escherichia coli]|nr:RNA polymerase sigma factor RpoE [Escherichia coli]
MNGQKGDQKAFNLLVVRYQHKVASLVSRYVPSGDVPDVVQEAFIKAYRALDSFRGDSAFYTWLYRIAVNTAKNYLVAQGVVHLPVMWMPLKLKTSKVAAR